MENIGWQHCVLFVAKLCTFLLQNTVADWFEKNQRNGRHHSVVLISKREIIHQPEDIMGIITVFDLPVIEEKL